MRRDPRLGHREPAEEEEGPSTRAWGLVLGVWIALFGFVGLIVVPLLFSVCTP